MQKVKLTLSVLGVIASFAFVATAQEQPPKPSAPKAVSVPAAQEKTLENGLKVAVVERTSSPLVTIQLMFRAGAADDGAKAGLANVTADMLAKGTASRTATQIAEDIEFLGGSINTGANWNNTSVAVTVTSDKLNAAMKILAEVVLHPKFDSDELDLLKSQTLDGLTYNLKQPGYIGNYVASKYSFGEHPAGGTPESIGNITRDDVVAFYSQNFVPQAAVLIFSGDTTLAEASQLAVNAFGKWQKASKHDEQGDAKAATENNSRSTPFRRMLVIDLPNSGQAAVTYAKSIPGIARKDAKYYSASVLNSVLGGGYSSRLNYEIRIKRGLSYGAGSSFGWRDAVANFATRTQTKNQSAAEVASLVLAELKRLTDSTVDNEELVPRKSVLTGGFGRNLETTNGLAGALADLYGFGLQADSLNSYVPSINAVTGDQVKEFASRYLLGGDMIIVGDYSVFKDDLAKRFPDVTVDVIKADELDLSKDSLRK